MDSLTKKSSPIRMPVLALSIVVISNLHYFTPQYLPNLHDIFQRLYYLPIILAALWFGVRGEQLRRAEKLSALGDMAAVLAHEVRNSSGSIRSTAEILRDDYRPGDPNMSSSRSKSGRPSA